MKLCQNMPQIIANIGFTFDAFNEIMETKDETITVKAGTFQTKYIKGKSNQNISSATGSDISANSGGTTEIWQTKQGNVTLEVKSVIIKSMNISAPQGSGAVNSVMRKELIKYNLP